MMQVSEVLFKTIELSRLLVKDDDISFWAERSMYWLEIEETINSKSKYASALSKPSSSTSFALSTFY